MKKITRYVIRTFFLFIILFMMILETNASHLVGGSMTYKCLGNNSYEITLIVYRDYSIASPFDSLALIPIYNSSGTLIRNLKVPITSITQVPVITNNPCLISPPNVCIEKAEYIFTTALQVSKGGLDLSYQRCCRNSSAINIIDPELKGSIYSIHIPDPNLFNCNSSPTFKNPPPTIMCAGYPFDYDLSANEIDGDSLFYDFADVFNSEDSSAKVPPYNNIPWSSGYSANYQIDANPQFTIDPQTGFLSGTPTQLGFYTFGIKVQEFRNSVFIAEITRDFLLIVANCKINTIAEFPAQTDLCTGKSISFRNTSINSSSFFWNFGDPLPLALTLPFL